MDQTAHAGLWEDLSRFSTRSFPRVMVRHDRVENARKRLLNWVQRLMRQNGLDAADLEAVFARVARQQVQQRMQPAEERIERGRRMRRDGTSKFRGGELGRGQCSWMFQ
jgi:hypothetical protein